MTFDSELRIRVGGETIEVWHTPPAHTEGDSLADVLAAARSARASGKSKEEFLRTVDLPACTDYDGSKDRFQEGCAGADGEAGGP